MSRIRAIKPETWTSETLAQVSIPAMVTFIAMTNYADDHGRHRDNAAVVYGLIWPMRGELNPVCVEEHLQQLETAGAICRYVGCDGRRYFHYPTWRKHQKIDKPSQSRLPACPHCAPERCGVCKGPCTGRPEASPNTPGGFAESSPNPPEPLDQPTRPAATIPAASGATPTSHPDRSADVLSAPEAGGGETAGQEPFGEVSPNTPRNVAEPSTPGSRILDPGSSSPTGRTAPADAASANQLIGEYIASCGQRPPGDVIGHLGRVTKKLLDEGIAPEHVRAGLRRFAEIQGHPSRLPSLVNDAMNARPGGLAWPGFRPTVPAHQAWTNPVDAATAYAEEL